MRFVAAALSLISTVSVTAFAPVRGPALSASASHESKTRVWYYAGAGEPEQTTLITSSSAFLPFDDWRSRMNDVNENDWRFGSGTFMDYKEPLVRPASVSSSNDDDGAHAATAAAAVAAKEAPRPATAQETAIPPARSAESSRSPATAKSEPKSAAAAPSNYVPFDDVRTRFERNGADDYDWRFGPGTFMEYKHFPVNGRGVANDNEMAPVSAAQEAPPRPVETPPAVASAQSTEISPVESAPSSKSKLPSPSDPVEAPAKSDPSAAVVGTTSKSRPKPKDEPISTAGGAMEQRPTTTAAPTTKFLTNNYDDWSMRQANADVNDWRYGTGTFMEYKNVPMNGRVSNNHSRVRVAAVPRPAAASSSPSSPSRSRSEVPRAAAGRGAVESNEPEQQPTSRPSSVTTASTARKFITNNYDDWSRRLGDADVNDWRFGTGTFMTYGG